MSVHIFTTGEIRDREGLHIEVLERERRARREREREGEDEDLLQLIEQNGGDSSGRNAGDVGGPLPGGRRSCAGAGLEHPLPRRHRLAILRQEPHLQRTYPSLSLSL